MKLYAIWLIWGEYFVNLAIAMCTIMKRSRVCSDWPNLITNVKSGDEPRAPEMNKYPAGSTYASCDLVRLDIFHLFHLLRLTDINIVHLDMQGNGKLRVIFESVIILELLFHIFYAAIDSQVKILHFFLLKQFPIYNILFISGYKFTVFIQRYN